MAAAGPKKPTVTQKHLVAALSDKHGLTKKQAGEYTDAFVTMICKHMKKGDKVRLPSLGVFMVRARKARMGRNPATGEAIKIKAARVPKFSAGKALKDAVN